MHAARPERLAWNVGHGPPGLFDGETPGLAARVNLT